MRTVVYINEGHILQVIPVKRGAICADLVVELRGVENLDLAQGQNILRAGDAHVAELAHVVAVGVLGLQNLKSTESAGLTKTS